MAPTIDQNYQRIALEEDNTVNGEKGQPIDEPTSSRLIRATILFSALASPILLLILVIRSYTGISTIADSSDNHHHHSPYPDIRSPDLQAHFLSPEPWEYDSYSPCGHSIVEARAAGCRWSAMSFSWSPPECYDDEIEAEFLAVHNWTWYSTEELLPGTELDRDAVIRGDIPNASMDSRFHNVHCIYTLKKIQRSLLGIALADNYMLRWDHAKHCEMYLMEDYKEMHSGGSIHSEIVAGKAAYRDCVVTG